MMLNADNLPHELPVSGEEARRVYRDLRLLLVELCAMSSRRISGPGVSDMGRYGVTIALPEASQIGGRANGLFLVKVEKDGGDAGSASGDCTFTYTVSTLEDPPVELATDLTPQRARHPLVEYLPGGTDTERSDYGLACYVGAALVLLDVFGEIPKTGEC